MGDVALTVGDRHLKLGRGPGRGLCCVEGDVDDDAVFQRVELGHGRIALRTRDGRYLAVRPDAGLGYGVHPEDDLTPRAAFEEILWPTGQVSLRSCHLSYVGAGPGGRVTANRVEAGPLERFVLLPTALPTVPGQRRPSPTPVASSRG